MSGIKGELNGTSAKAADVTNDRDRPSSGQKIYNIQALRALAAWAVVFHHLVDSLHSYIAIERSFPQTEIGSFGVEIFFVISGYVMMMTVANRPVRPLPFLTERTLRISPPYWILTLLAFGAIFSGLKMFSNKHATLDRLFSSLFYLPYFGQNGLEKPIVFPGWTLNYEMMFYALFAAVLFLRSERARVLAIVLSLLAALGGQMFTQSPLLDYIGRDIIVGFGLGVLLWPLIPRIRVGVASASVAIVVGVIGLFLCDAELLRNWEHVELAVSLASFLIVAGAVLLERRGKRLVAPWVIFQGDASYALYLIHPFALQAVGKVSIVLGINRTLPGIYATLLAMIAASAIAAALFHRWFERPVHRRARRLLLARPRAV